MEGVEDASSSSPCCVSSRRNSVSITAPMAFGIGAIYVKEKSEGNRERMKKGCQRGEEGGREQ